MMAAFINEALWRKAFQRPDWYLAIYAEFARLEEVVNNEPDPDVRKQIKREAYGAVEAAVRENRIALADHGPDLDTERQPIDRAVIHHTKNAPGMTLERLNAIQLLRIYGRYYAHPTDSREKHFKGQAVWSGHFYNNQQVFWGYHWLIREDGAAERILDDRYVGWHAGNWDINTRSVGICIDDDLSDKEPSAGVLSSIVQVLHDHYPQITYEEIIGHREANPQTVCPGELFLPSWKNKLRSLLVSS